MRPVAIVLVTALFTLVGGTFAEVHATDCMQMKVRKTPVIDALEGSAIVFAGTVEGVGTADGGSTRVTFKVVEAFKGASRGQRKVEFSNYFGSFRFQPGQQVLVFAHRFSEEELFVTTACSRTGLLDAARADLLELRQYTRRQGLAHATQHKGS